MLTSSATRPASGRVFVVGFVIGLLPAIVFALLGERFLRRSYESASHEQIVAAQMKRPGIYGSALRNDFYGYKVALYRATLPKIVAIGSSRTMELQQLGFRDSFVTLGGAVRSIGDGERLLAEMKATGHMPEIVLFGVDYWWFNAEFQGPNDRAGVQLVSRLDAGKQAVERWLGTWFLPARWLYNRKIGVRELIGVSLGDQQLAPPLPRAYGLGALNNLRGFASDGHYRYLGDAFGKFVEPDRGFAESLGLIRRGGERFAFGVHPAEDRFARFHALVAAFEAAGSHVITFVPPVATAVLDEHARQGSKLAYIPETLERLQRERPVHFDFLDPRTLGADNCEFVDAYHGGEVIYLRVVLAIASDPRSGLGPHVDRELLRTTIQRTAGRVIVDGDSFLPRYKEVDFLELGCAK